MSTPTSEQARISNLTDEGLAFILDPKNWLPLCDGEGNPILRPDGSYYLKPPPAAYYGQAIKRLGQLGVVSDPSNKDSAASQLWAAARKRLKLTGTDALPPMSEDDDEATAP